jgi:hypothetical protein
MNKLKQCFPLTILILGATDLSQVSLAQYNVPMQPPVPRHDTMFPRRNRSTGSSQPISAPESQFTVPNKSASPLNNVTSSGRNNVQIISSPPSLDKFCAQLNNDLRTMINVLGDDLYKVTPIGAKGVGTLIVRAPSGLSTQMIQSSVCNQ